MVLTRSLALVLCGTLSLAQTCDRSTCRTSCVGMDDAINICLGHWQGRGKSSLSECVCTYHDNPLARLQSCVACDISDIGSNQPLYVYQSWLVLCDTLANQGNAAAVALEPAADAKDLVEPFSQTYLPPIQSFVCGGAKPTSSATSSATSTISITSGMPDPTPTSAATTSSASASGTVQTGAAAVHPAKVHHTGQLLTTWVILALEALLT